MYICNECGDVFTQPELRIDVEKHYELSEMGNVPCEEFRSWACPHCGSGDFDVADECVICGDYCKKDAVLCTSCTEELEQKLEEVKVSMSFEYDSDFELAVATVLGY